MKSIFMINKLKILQFICLSLIIVCVLYFKEINHILLGSSYLDVNNESFIDTHNNLGATIAYEYDNVNSSDYPPTIFEESINNQFGEYKTMVCNILPTKTSNECKINGLPIVKYKFPVHIMKLPDGVNISVFNDGRMYKKRNLTDKMWQGPLRHSMPNRNVPLRMITLSPLGDKLVGVGYDNRGYIKLKDPNNNVSIDTEWQYIPGMEDIIFISFMYDEASNMNKYVIVNTSGVIQMSNTDNASEGFFDASIIKEKVLKLYYDVDGYMMIIDNAFKLRVFEDKDWMTSELSKKFPANPNPVIDILYDYDQLLFGCVFLPKMGICEIMKQEDPAFMSPFVPFELNKFMDYRQNRRLTDRLILKTKMGIYTNLGLMEEELLDDDINMAYQRQQLKDKKKLREFCLKRGIQTDVNYKNYEMEKEIDKNARKIQKIETAIKNLINFDPDIKAIQDSTLGINFISEDDINLLNTNTNTNTNTNSNTNTNTNSNTNTNTNTNSNTNSNTN
jgi:hypothetical protein